MERRLIAWGPAAVWAAVLFFLGALPGVTAGDLPVSDKVIHLGLYAVLGGTLAWGRLRAARAPGHLLLVGVGILFGLVDEVHQAYVPGRDPSPGDVVADTVGVLLGYTIVLTLSRHPGLPGSTGTPRHPPEHRPDD